MSRVKSPVAALLALGCLAGAAAASPLRTGLHGYARKGPITPVCYENIPCDGPAAGVILTFTRADGRIARVKANEAGFYRIRLPVGRYSVKSSQGYPPVPYPRSVKVRAGHDDRLDFHIDTGLQ